MNMIQWFKRELYVFPLQLNHGIEIGAALAYKGHYERTKDIMIKHIMIDELYHQIELLIILKHYKSRPCKIINSIFFIIGHIIKYLCKFNNERLMNKIAQFLEVFAVWSYSKLSHRYKSARVVLERMGRKELKHENYFKGLK